MAKKNWKDPSTWIRTSNKYGYYHVPTHEVVGYASVDFSINLFFQGVSLYISYYYTDVVGLRAAHVALLFLLSRFWDAINDPLMSVIIERRSPKAGKYVPYIIWGAIPFAVLSILTYGVPEGMTYAKTMCYAAITYNLLNMAYTFVTQPYLAALTLMTNDQNERVHIQSWHMTGSQIGGVVIAIFLPQVSSYLSNYFSLARSYMLSTACLAVIMVICLIWGAKQLVERIPPVPFEKQKKAGIKNVFGLFRHGCVLVMILMFLCVYGMSQIQSTMGPYYIKYFAGREDMVSWFSMAMMLSSVIGVPMVPFWVSRFKKKGCVMFGMAVAAVGCLGLYLMPASAIAGMMVCRIITGYGYGVLMGIIWTVCVDPLEYVDYTTGERYASAFSAIVCGFGVKGAMIIGGSLTTFILDSFGYVANQTQTTTVINVIRSLTGLLPFGVLVVGMLLYGFFYHLDEEKISFYQHEIAVRNGVSEEV